MDRHQQKTGRAMILEVEVRRDRARVRHFPLLDNRPSPRVSLPESVSSDCCRKVDVRLPGKGNSNSNGARPVHLIITMIKWIRTSRLSIKNSLSLSSEFGI